MTQPAPQLLPIDYLECARMDIHGNAVARDNTLFVRLDDVDAVIDTLKAERSRSRPHTSTPNKTCDECECRFGCKKWMRVNPTEHDTAIRNATLKTIIDLIKQTDEGACPHNQCRRGEGHDNLNCRDCLIKWIEDSLRTNQEPHP